MANPKISESVRREIDSTPREKLSYQSSLIAQCLSRAVVRRATDPGHGVGSFLHDLAEAGLQIVPVKPPAAPRRPPAKSAAEAKKPPAPARRGSALADPFRPHAAD